MRRSDTALSTVPSIFRLLVCSLVALAGCPASAADDDGIELEVVYTGDVWSNVAGGIRRDEVYLDKLLASASVDAGRALGWDGATLGLSGLYGNRHNFSDGVVGDFQAISNIEAGGAFRLYEAWVEQRFGAVSIKAGLIDLNSEFDVNDTGSLFVSSSHGIGPDFSQIGEKGPSIFPLPGLAARVAAELSQEATLRVAAFEGTPRRSFPDWGGSHRGDILLTGELEFRPSDDAKILLGGWRHGSHPSPVTHSRRVSVGGYALAEGVVARSTKHSVRGFVRIGHTDSKVNQFAAYRGVGVALSGPVLAGAARDEKVGLALAVLSNGKPFRRSAQLAGNPVEKRELAFEFTYQVSLAPWLILQPDVQYIVNPGTDPLLNNALAAGLRFQLLWTQ